VAVQLQPASGGVASPGRGPRTVQGNGGYSYEQYPDGTLVIRAGPGIHAPVRLTPEKALNAITAEIGLIPSARGAGTNTCTQATEEVALEGGRWLDWLAEQANTVGEAASDLFVTAGEWADRLTGAWFSDEAPARDAPVAPGDRSNQAEEAKLAAGTGTPLELALTKVGKVEYVDPKHGEGAGMRDFTTAETSALKKGSSDIQVASCSPFAYWTLAASGININAPIKGAGASIREYVNNEGVKDEVELRSLVDASDERIQGAAAAFEKAKIGAKVSQEEACPGDYVQTWTKGYQGHSTIVHRAHCKGAAVFGVEGSPTRVDTVPSGAPPFPAGFNSEPVRFILDEKTKPETVRDFITEKVELLGANLAGKDDSGKNVQSGVYTKQALSLDDFYRVFIGRLSSSVWTKHEAADPSKFLK